jgi:hypothetical protein
VRMAEDEGGLGYGCGTFHSAFRSRSMGSLQP